MAKFYVYNQNNSGGSFDVNSNVREYVIIEAEDYKQANEKAEEVGIYFDGCYKGQDCDCCGDRWYEASEYDKTYDKPMIYGESVYEMESGLFTKGCIIHYLDGRREEVEFK